MQIGQLLAGYPDRTSAGERKDRAESGDLQAADQPQQRPTLSAGLTAVLRQIAGRYNVTEISPREFSDMLDELHQNGALTDDQMQQLARVRVDLDLENVDADEEVDLVDFYADRLEQLLRSDEDGDRPTDAFQAEQLLGWMEKFAVIQSSADVSGVDAFV